MKNNRKNSSCKIILSHYSALTMYRYARIYGAKLLKCDDNKKINARRPSVEETKLLTRFLEKQTGKFYKLEVLLDDVAKRKNSAILTCHSSNFRLNGKYFCKITSNDEVKNATIFHDIILVCPEITLAQMSKTVPAWKTLQWVMEFFGNYVVDINNTRGFIACRPLLNKIDNLNFYKDAEFEKSKICNSKNMSICTKFLQKNSASPAETNLYILLCDPRRLGFFQTLKMDLNKEYVLSETAYSLCGQATITPDLSIKKKKVAIEYDSREFHAKVMQDQKDKRRLMALEHDGWKVFVVVPYQMNNYQAFCQIAHDILKACGQETRIRTKNFYSHSRSVFYALQGR